MAQEFELEPYDATRRDAYLGLLGDAWGSGALGGDLFDWWYEGNPAGSVRSVAVRDGDVVGAAGHTLQRFVVDGRQRLGQFSVHAVTAPSARGLGIFQALERRHEEQGRDRGSMFVLGFASKPTHGIFLSRLEWQQIDWTRAWARALPLGLRGGTRPLERFGERHDEVYASVAPRLRAHVVRDSRYLNWRYVESPRRYRLLEAPGGGFAAVGFTRRGGLPLALVMDLVGEAGDVNALVRGALAAARGCVALLVVPTPILTRARLARHGFVPTPYRLDFMGRGLAEPLDTRPEAWSFSFGDMDFF